MKNNMSGVRVVGLFLITFIVFLGIYSTRYVQGIEQSEEKPGDEFVIQEQIDALGREGGVVELKAKTYLINRSIVLRDNVTIKGAGMDKTIIRMADGATSSDVPSRVPRLDYADRSIIRNEKCDELKTPEGNHDITIRDLTIDGNTAKNPRVSEGIFLANCYNYRIENVHVKNCRGVGGILTNPCHQAKRNGIKYKNYILNSIVEGNQPAYGRDAAYGHGIYVTARDNDNVLVKGCIVRNNYASGIHGEDGIAYFFVEENEVYGNRGAGIWFCEVRNSLIKKNRIHHNGEDGIYMSQSVGSRNNLICENDIHHNKNGIRASNPEGNYHTILSNRIWNNRSAAIYIHKGSTGNTIAFNLCYNEGNKQVQGGIVVESAGNSIINNYVGTRAKDKIQLAKGNTLVEWESRRPFTPETLVWQLYSSRTNAADSTSPEEPGPSSKIVTVSSGADIAEIQKKIDSLGEDGGVVQFGKGTYTIEKAIVLRNNVTIKGAGIDKTIIRMADGAASSNVPSRVPRLGYADRAIFRNEKCDELKTPEGNHDITIRDLTIDGNAAKNPMVGEGIFLANCYNYRIENVHVKNCRGVGGIYTNPCHAAKGVPKNYILNCIVENNQPTRGRDTVYGHGIYVTAWDNDNVLIKGCILRNNAGSGINLEDKAQWLFVEDNECYGNRQFGIWMDSVSNCVLKRNRIHHNTQGIHMSNSARSLLYGNEIHSNLLEGIYMGFWGHLPHSKDRSETNPTHHVIVGNTIYNNELRLMQGSAGIHVETRSNIIAFNFVYDDQEDKTQFIPILAYAPDNVVVNNCLGPSAYRNCYDLMSVGVENIYVPWEKKSGWRMEDLVSRY